MAYTNDEIYAGLRDLCWMQLMIKDELLVIEESNATIMEIITKHLPGISDAERERCQSLSARFSTALERCEAQLADLKSGFSKLPETSAKSPFSI